MTFPKHLFHQPADESYTGRRSGDGSGGSTALAAIAPSKRYGRE
jgi:hypothetical protein